MWNRTTNICLEGKGYIHLTIGAYLVDLPGIEPESKVLFVYVVRIPYIINMNCINCNKETNNPKFCSRSCAAKYTNKVPKRSRTGKCKSCGCIIKAQQTYCNNCVKPKIDYTNMTLGQLKSQEISKHPSFY